MNHHSSETNGLIPRLIVLIAMMLAPCAFATPPQGQAPLPPRSASEGLRPLRVRHSLLGSHEWYAQTFQGIDVEGGYVVVHVSNDGSERVDDWRKPVDEDLDVRPALDRMSAEAKTARQVGKPTRHGTLIILPGVPSHLAWSVEAKGRHGPVRSLIDAHSGKLLRTQSRAVYDQGIGRIFDPNPPVTLQLPFPVSDPTLAYKTVTLTHLDSSGYLHGDYAKTVSFSYGQGRTFPEAYSSALDFEYNYNDASAVFFDQTQAYYDITRSQEYVQSLGFTDDHNCPMRVVAAAGILRGTELGAYYYGGCNTDEIDLASDLGWYPDAAQDADITDHEYGHALQFSVVYTPNDDYPCGEGSFIAENFADYWAATMHQPVSNGYRDGWVFEAGEPLEPGYTLADFPRTQEPVCIPYGTPIWSAALWDINQALGRDEANRIILESHYFFPSQPTFADAAAATIFAAHGLYGAGAAATVTAILAARGIQPTPSPVARIALAPDQRSPTNQQPIHFIALFSTAANGLTAADFVLHSGGAGGALTLTDNGDHSLYTLTVSGLTSDTCVYVELPAGVMTDADGRPNPLVQSPNVCLDTTAPSVALQPTFPDQTSTNVAPLLFDLVMLTGERLPFNSLTGASVVLSGSAGATTATVTEDDETYPVFSITYRIAVSGMQRDGEVIITLPPGAIHDAAGNGNAQALSASLTYSTATQTDYNGTQMAAVGDTLYLFGSTGGLGLWDYSCVNAGVSYVLDRDPNTGAEGEYSLGSAALSDPPPQVVTTGWQENRYLLTVRFAGASVPTRIWLPDGGAVAGTVTCAPSQTQVALTIGEPGDFAHAQGRFDDGNGNTIGVSFDVRRPPQGGDYKGEVHLVSEGVWRLDGTLDNYLHAGAYGAAHGTGTLSHWDPTANGGAGGWVANLFQNDFTFSFADGTGRGTGVSDFGYASDPWLGLYALPAPLVSGQAQVH